MEDITSSNSAQLMTTTTANPSFENYILPLHGDMQISVIEVVVFEKSVIKIDARHMEFPLYNERNKYFIRPLYVWLRFIKTIDVARSMGSPCAGPLYIFHLHIGFFRMARCHFFSMLELLQNNRYTFSSKVDFAFLFLQMPYLGNEFVRILCITFYKRTRSS